MVVAMFLQHVLGKAFMQFCLLQRSVNAFVRQLDANSQTLAVYPTHNPNAKLHTELRIRGLYTIDTRETVKLGTKLNFCHKAPKTQQSLSL